MPTGPSSSGAPEQHASQLHASYDRASRDHATERRVAEVGVLLVVLCWAANFVIVKAAIGEVPPLVFTGLRYIVATATVLAILRWREGTIRMPLPDIAKAAALGVLGFAVYQACWTLGLTQITAGDSALLIAATPVIVALISVPLGTDTLTPAKIVGIFVSFLGVGLVVTAGADGALSLGDSLAGDLITLAAAVVWAFYTSLAARLMRRMTPLQLTGWSVAGGCALLVPAAIWQAAVSPPFTIDLAVVAAIVYSGTLAAGVANILISRGVLVLGPTRVTVLQYGVPALAVVFGAIFLGEAVRPAQLLGGVVIILGVVITRGVPGGMFARLRRGDAAA